MGGQLTATGILLSWMYWHLACRRLSSFLLCLSSSDSAVLQVCRALKSLVIDLVVFDGDFSNVLLELVRVCFCFFVVGNELGGVFVALENPLDFIGGGGVGAWNGHDDEGLSRLVLRVTGDVGDRRAWGGGAALLGRCG
jgi:hypothetical protein